MATETTAANSNERLIWIDLEMTGLDTDRDGIIEIATVVTDGQLNWLADGPDLAVAQPLSTLEAMDDWNRNQHGKSGLWQRVLEEGVPLAEAEARTLAFLREWVPANASPMCGNSICQDRRFMARLMPSWRRTSTTATWTSAPSRNLRVGGRPPRCRDSTSSLRIPR